MTRSLAALVTSRVTRSIATFAVAGAAFGVATLHQQDSFSAVERSAHAVHVASGVSRQHAPHSRAVVPVAAVSRH